MAGEFLVRLKDDRVNRDLEHDSCVATSDRTGAAPDQGSGAPGIVHQRLRPARVGSAPSRRARRFSTSGKLHLAEKRGIVPAVGLMRYLDVDEVLDLHRLVLERSGGAPGLRDRGALESSIAQPQMAFGGEDLYPTLVEKASALGFSLIQNHPFVD